MRSTFYPEGALDLAREANKSYWNGYLILFDIKNSTANKKERPGHWYAYTETFYRGAIKLRDAIQDAISTVQMLDDEDRQIVLKFSGDSAMLFVPVSYSGNPDDDENPAQGATQKILELALSFRDDTHSQKEMGGLRLKLVVTYLTEIRKIIFGSDGEATPHSDVLGRGIDFSFRIERFAGDSYVVCNSMFAQSLFGKSENGLSSLPNYPSQDVVGVTQYCIPVSKRLKGWKTEGGEKFFLLVNPDALQFQPTIHPEREDVEAELFTFSLSQSNALQTEEGLVDNFFESLLKDITFDLEGGENEPK